MTMIVTCTMDWTGSSRKPGAFSFIMFKIIPENFMIIFSIVNGGWSEWTSWSTCGQNCQKSRSRLCNNPTPANGGSECSGENTEDMSCSGGNCVRDPVIITRSQTVDVSSWNVAVLKVLLIGGGGGGRVILMYSILGAVSILYLVQ